MRIFLILPLIFLFFVAFASASIAECATSSCIGWINGNCLGWVGPIATPGNSCSSDGDVCTTDVCGAEPLQCLHNPIAGCCNVDADCDDGNGATLDSCSSHICSHITISTPTPCDDGNACTVNDMSLAGVCIGAPLTCNDNNPITNDSCNPSTGCVYTPTCIPATEECNGVDDDCDGLIDEDWPKLTNHQDGLCAGNMLRCVDGNLLLDYEPTPEICDGLDNNCNGQIDEDMDAPDAFNQQGVCVGYEMVCAGSDGWIIPDDYTYPPHYDGAIELSCDGLDNNCDGTIDEGCDDPSVPEFGIVAGGIALVGALGRFLYRRK